MFDGGKRVAPDCSFAPSFAFFFSFIGGTHRFPGNAFRVADVLCGSLPSLLMNQVQVAERRLLAGFVFKEKRLGGKFEGAGDSIVAGIGDGPRTVSFEFKFAELI